MTQSPIVLDTKTALPLFCPTDLLSIDYPLNQSYQGTFTPHDRVHGNFELSGSFPHIRFKGRQFKLLRVHIHKISEHIVNVDEPSDYEVHFLHVPDDGKLDDPKVVIGILYRESCTGLSSHGFEEFAKGLPTRASLKTMPTTTPARTHSITPSRFFPLLLDEKSPDFQNWFHYEGSLTSYSYSEDVSWFVMRDEAIVAPSVTQRFGVLRRAGPPCTSTVESTGCGPQFRLKRCLDVDQREAKSARDCGFGIAIAANREFSPLSIAASEHEQSASRFHSLRQQFLAAHIAGKAPAETN